MKTYSHIPFDVLRGEEFAFLYSINVNMDKYRDMVESVKLIGSKEK